MKRDWLKMLGGIALAATMAGGTMVYAQDNGWDEWDADSSGDISYDEWDTGFDDEGLYSDWDNDGDGALSEEEFGQGIYEGYDNNGDGVWDQEEYQMYQDDAGENGFWDV